MSEFSREIKKRATIWSKAAQAKPGATPYLPPDVPDGEYEAVVSVSYGLSKGGALAGTPYVVIRATICEGEHEGKEPSKFYFLEGKEPSKESGGLPTAEERLVADLKTLLPDLDVEKAIQESPESLESLLVELDQISPLVLIGVRNRTGKKGTSSEGKKFQDVYFNQRLDLPVNEISLPEESEEEEELQAPAKGDRVMYRPKGTTSPSEFEVAEVDHKSQTVVLSNGRKRIKGVSWKDLDMAVV